MRARQPQKFKREDIAVWLMMAFFFTLALMIIIPNVWIREPKPSLNSSIS
ncbi:unnamed protein product [Phytomonas sp. EM1]|nr:unnamed protein product [Phytomonas sp. EM1]|eukprot:CCW65802.1 unnamed protein product [Phytomonas sp. isolate EM1]